MASSPLRVPYVRLGCSGLWVSKIILGCSGYGSSDWHSWVKNEEDSIVDIKAAFDMGINTFDTADVYSNGQSEVVLGKAVRAHNISRKSIVVMTKLLSPVAPNMDEHFHGRARVSEADSAGYVNQHGLSRKHIFDAIADSLERLQMDYVDVLQCHGFDAETPISETMQALHEVVKAGHARYIGMTGCRAWEFHAMQNYATTHGLTAFISFQNNYNLLYREDERELLPMLKHLNVSALPYSVLANGGLIIPVDEQQAKADDRIAGGRKDWHEQIINRVAEIARGIGKDIPQVAIAWGLTRTSVAALVLTPPSSRHLKAAICALSIELSPTEISYLDALYQPQSPIVSYS